MPRGPRVIYGPYQRRRMAERNVTEEEVEAVLADPLLDVPSRDAPDRRVLTGRPNGRKVSVVVVAGSDPTVVITVWAD